MARSVVFIDRINSVFEELLDVQNKQMDILKQRKDKIANDKQSIKVTGDIQPTQSDKTDKVGENEKTDQTNIREEGYVDEVQTYGDDIKDVFIDVQNAHDCFVKMIKTTHLSCFYRLH